MTIYIVSYNFMRARLVLEDMFDSIFPQLPIKNTKISYLDYIIVLCTNVAKYPINKGSLATSMVSSSGSNNLQHESAPRFLFC